MYMLKNTIKSEALEHVSANINKELSEAKRIIQGEGGKFVIAIDGGVCKIGVLLPVVK